VLGANYMLGYPLDRIDRRPRARNGYFAQTLLVCPHATHYHNFFFNELRNQISELAVIYAKDVIPSHPWRTRAPRRHVSRVCRTICGVDWQSLRTVVGDSRSAYVVAGWNSFTNVLLLVLLRLLRRDFGLFSDTPASFRHRSRPKRIFRTALLRWLCGGARVVFATGRPEVTAFAEMGVPEHKLENLPFFVDLDYYKRTARQHDPSLLVHFVSSGRVQNSVKGHDVA